MKANLRSNRPLKFLFVLSAATLLTASGAFANWSVNARSTGAGSHGVIGLATNWRTYNGAVNAAVSNARYNNNGYLNGWSTVWWTDRGWGAATRGYDYTGTYAAFGAARGWSTRNSAINAAYRQLGYYYNWYFGMAGYNY